MAKILVIEDSRAIAEMLLLLIKMNKHEAQVAYGTRKVHDMIIEFKPDLIMIDVIMEEGSGKDLCKDIKATNKKIPIILMSANAQQLEDYHICEADDILEKPFDISTVIEKINKLI